MSGHLDITSRSMVPVPKNSCFSGLVLLRKLLCDPEDDDFLRDRSIVVILHKY